MTNLDKELERYLLNGSSGRLSEVRVSSHKDRNGVRKLVVQAKAGPHEHTVECHTAYKVVVELEKWLARVRAEVRDD